MRDVLREWRRSPSLPLPGPPGATPSTTHALSFFRTERRSGATSRGHLPKSGSDRCSLVMTLDKSSANIDIGHSPVPACAPWLEGGARLSWNMNVSPAPLYCQVAFGMKFNRCTSVPSAGGNRSGHAWRTIYER